MSCIAEGRGERARKKHENSNMDSVNSVFSTSSEKHTICYGDGDDILGGEEKGRGRCLEWQMFSKLDVGSVLVRFPVPCFSLSASCHKT